MSDLERHLDAVAQHFLDMTLALVPPEPLFSPFREAGRRWAASQAAARQAEKEDRERWIADVKRRLGLVGPGELGYRIETEVRFRVAATHDLTRTDYAFRAEDDGQRGHIACWTGTMPRVGDYLILRNGDGGGRYQATAVDPCWGVDPPTMWMADLVFAPRPGGEP